MNTVRAILAAIAALPAAVTADERRQLRAELEALFATLRKIVIRLVLLAVAGGAGGLAVMTIVVSQATSTAPPLIDVGPKVIAPATVGLARAIDICKYGTVSRQLTADAGGYKYTAIFGLEVLQWPDDPPDKQPIALVNGEPVQLSEDVVECLKGKF